MRPRRPLLYPLALLTGVGLGAAWWPTLIPVWKGLGLLVGGLSLADLMLLLGTRAPNAERRLGHILPQGAWTRVELDLYNLHRRPLSLTCHDRHPPTFAVQDLPRTLTIAPRTRARLRYRVRPPRRGQFLFDGCDVRIDSPLGLWGRRRRLDLDQSVRVYPNFAEISRYTLLAANDQLAQLGVRRQQRRGGGAEFHQLREYRRGDSLRQIDWKATSRMRKLIAREYQDERDQRLLFLLDCGRRMRHQSPSGTGHLDEALNALLLLAYVAVRQGDAVGLMTYGGPRRWFAPRKEADTVNRLLGAVYDLEAGMEAADPLTAARELMQAQPRRAMVVCITNSRDEDHPELIGAVRLLKQRHLVVIADLRESSLDRALAEPIGDRAAALRFHGVQSYLDDRRCHHERLHHLGALVLDLLPSQLPIALINQYFTIKRAGRL